MTEMSEESIVAKPVEHVEVMALDDSQAVVDIGDVGRPESDAEDITTVGKPAEAIIVDETLDDDLALFDLDLKAKKKKKKKKSKKVVVASDQAEVEANLEGRENGLTRPWDGSDRAYTYTEMLDRVFSLLREKNPNLSERKRHVMPPPQLVRVGTRKTMWTNINQICVLLNRSMDHLISFFMTELGTEGSVDGNFRLVIKGRFVPKQVESLLKKYMVEYVICHMCRNPETTLTRDSVTRLYFLKCEMCGSQRSVAPIKSGFHATLRADRRAAKK